MIIPIPWRRALPGFVLMLLAVLVLYRQTGLAMVEIWDRSETFAHAFVVPPISLWLIWRQRAVLALLTPRPAPVFLLPVAGAGLLWLLGDMAAVNSATQLAFVALLVLTVPTTLGWPVARSIAFPLGFLFFCVPLGEFMLPTLMEWTADFTVMAVRLSGVPLYREGLQFVIPTGSWSVIEACSGIRYMIASVMVGALFAYLNYRSMKRRYIFVGVAVVLPVLANWIRAYMIVMLGHLSGNKLATGVDHLVYGWIFFGIVMLALFTIGARWAEPDAPVEVRPVLDSEADAPPRWYVLAVLAALICVPPVLVKSLGNSGAPGVLALVAPDLASQGWVLANEPVAAFKPAFDNSAAEKQFTYLQPSGAKIGLYAAYYRHQGYDSKLISSNNVLVKSNDKAWSRVGNATIMANGLTWRTSDLREASLADGSDSHRLRAWEVYWINGHWTTSDWQAKVFGVLGQLAGQGDDAAVLVLYTNKVGAGQDDEALGRFMRDNGGALDAWFAGIRNAGRKYTRN